MSTSALEASALEAPALETSAEGGQDEQAAAAFLAPQKFQAWPAQHGCNAVASSGAVAMHLNFFPPRNRRIWPLQNNKISGSGYRTLAKAWVRLQCAVVRDRCWAPWKIQQRPGRTSRQLLPSLHPANNPPKKPDQLSTAVRSLDVCGRCWAP